MDPRSCVQGGDNLTCVDSSRKHFAEYSKTWTEQRDAELQPKITSEDDEEEYFIVAAPPPSPQEPSMLEAVFAEQLSRSLEAAVRSMSEEDDDDEEEEESTIDQERAPNNDRENVSWRHARALDKLLRRTQRKQHSIKKRRQPRKPKNLRHKTANDLADAIALIRISSTATNKDDRKPWQVPDETNE